MTDQNILKDNEEKKRNVFVGIAATLISFFLTISISYLTYTMLFSAVCFIVFGEITNSKSIFWGAYCIVELALFILSTKFLGKLLSKVSSTILLLSVTFSLIVFLVFIKNVYRSNNLFDIENVTGADEKVWPLKPERYPSYSAHYRRDSLFIATTIWEFIDKKVDIFAFYKRYHIPLKKVRIDVDTIIYSPDSLKLVSFVIEHKPESSTPNEYYYSGSDMIGYRNTIHEPWIIYYLGEYRPTGFENYNAIKSSFRDYYFHKFKDASDFFWNNSTKDVVSEDFGYNLNDPRFWTKSLVWRKGARLPGLYNFQTTGNVRPGDENAIVIIPKLNYSDSLLKLYK